MAVDQADFYDIFLAPITYYKQPLEEMGKKAVQFLIANIEGDNSQTLQEIIKGHLVIP